MIPTLADIYGTHQPDTRNNLIDGCIACPDTRHTTWAEHAAHVQTVTVNTYRVDVASDLAALPDETLVIDTVGNVTETGGDYDQGDDGWAVELPVWILPRIDQMGAAS